MIETWYSLAALEGLPGMTPISPAVDHPTKLCSVIAPRRLGLSRYELDLAKVNIPFIEPPLILPLAHVQVASTSLYTSIG